MAYGIVGSLEAVHNGRQGHHGVKRTWDMIQKLYPQKGITMQEVRAFVEDCPICQKNKEDHRPSIPPLVKNLRSEHARNKVAMDLVTIDAEAETYKYILVVYNLFTKYVHLFPVQDKTARTTATCMVVYFSMYGLHDIVHSDPGSDYTSKELKDLLTEFLGMARSFTLTNNPQADGVEPVIGQILRHIRALCLDKDLALPWHDPVSIALIQLVLNETPPYATGVSPLEAHFGLLDSQHFVIPDTVRSTCDSKWVQAIAQQLRHIRAKVKENQQQYLAAHQPEPPIHQPRYQPGDFVLVIRDKGHKIRKLATRGEGPYRVMQHPFGSNHVVLQSLVDDAQTTHDCKDLRVFTGTPEEATRLARAELEQFPIERIVGHTGDVTKRTNMFFYVQYSDGDTVALPWGSDITSTAAFEAYCRADRRLSLLLKSAREATVLLTRHRKAVIPAAFRNAQVYLNLRCYGPAWYESLQQLPNHLTTNYYVLGRYGEFLNEKLINIHIPVFSQVMTATYEFVYYWGYRDSLPEDGVLLSSEDITKYAVK
jgi:hypothetical protein